MADSRPPAGGTGSRRRECDVGRTGTVLGRYAARVKPVRFALAQLGYDLRSGLLFRPAVWIFGFGALGVVMPPVEALFFAGVSAWLAAEPATAQVVLGTLAGSMMSVVSVVYSILLVALSLASIQFSTRILAGMTRDKVSQNTLGLFVGTFVYCLVVLRSVHTDPPFVPGLSLTIAMASALTSLGALVYFIHHIIRSIQANHLVDRIATETEAVIDEVFGAVVAAAGTSSAEYSSAEPESVESKLRASGVAVGVVTAESSGYVQLIDAGALRAVAAAGHPVVVDRPMGSFAVEGLPLAHVGGTPSETLLAAVRDAFDLGPVRTMQSDVEFGFRQIVDIALKAISPAVNDPSTACTCIDHLSRLLVRAARYPAIGSSPSLELRPVRHGDLVDLSFEQIRQYGKTDMAVALRLLRAMGDVASVLRDEDGRARLQMHARVLERSVRGNFSEEDCEELGRRFQTVFSAR